MVLTIEQRLQKRYDLRQQLHDSLQGVKVSERKENAAAQALFDKLRKVDNKLNTIADGTLTLAEKAAFETDPSGVGTEKMIVKGAQWSKNFTKTMYEEGKIVGFYELGDPGDRADDTGSDAAASSSDDEAKKPPPATGAGTTGRIGQS